ncbi:MAG: menaquinone biosynthetic enzyme MqnA/MqnD family protein [Syntrophobacteraceae bacterium]
MGPGSGECLKLGKIGFLNVLPIYHPLETGIVSHPFEIVSGHPARLNGLMARGELDLSVVSSVEVARNPERYFVIPELSIGCLGAVQSVLLLSRKPIELLDGQRILATTQSHTSVALLKILFQVRMRRSVSLTSGNCTEAVAGDNPPEAFLAIGDEALRLREDPRYPFQMDLGEAWHRWTGLPFVFALWVVQRRTVERAHGDLAGAIQSLHAAKAWGQSHLDEVCAIAARSGILDEHGLRFYYQALRFDLDDAAKLGLNLFFQYLQAIGEIARVPQIEILRPLARAA